MAEIPAFSGLTWLMPKDHDNLSSIPSNGDEKHGWFSAFPHESDLTLFKSSKVDIATFEGYIFFYANSMGLLSKIVIGFDGLAIMNNKPKLSLFQSRYSERSIAREIMFAAQNINKIPLTSSQIRRGVSSFKKLFGKGQSFDLSENLEWYIGNTHIKTYYDTSSPTQLDAVMIPISS